jgi:hypothetical protein
VVHPAHLDAALTAAWGRVLADYEIIPPFAQLGRGIARPDPADLDSREITRFAGPKIPGVVLYRMLEGSHWLHDPPGDGGGFVRHSRHFPAARVTAFIRYTPGLTIGWYETPQELESVYFVAGHIQTDRWGGYSDDSGRLRIGDVDPVVLSEVLRLAHALVSKAA